jgi:predicted amidohydrolase YtcJ
VTAPVAVRDTMADDLIITAASVITMDPSAPRATAVAVDGATGRITAVGDLAWCRAACPDATVRDLGDTVLMPGFVESHSHPFVSGVATQAPAHWIAPYAGYPTWGDVTALFRKLHSETPAGQTLFFNGLDRLLHGCDAPTAEVLDGYFPDRPVVVADNSGHAAYCTTAFLQQRDWIAHPPVDPPASHFGRNPDGSLNGQAFEVGAMMRMTNPAIAAVVTNPIASAAEWFALMSRNGITSTADMGYQSEFKVGYEALLSMESTPMRIALYQMSTEADCGDAFVSTIPESMLHKRGIKLWADGSPWVGNVALSFPYLDTPVTRKAGIRPDTGGLAQMNYSQDQLEFTMDEHASQGWQMSVHINGDLAFDVVLAAYRHALTANGLLGTDHRWRVEHLGACHTDQFAVAAELGIYASMGPFQFIYWGDLLDGQMFPTEIGANWMRWKDALDAGLRPSYHNDGAVSPPLPLRNIQTAITRRTISGTVRGPGQIVSLDDALRAQTIDAAFILRREDEVGSIEVGKFADFVELSADPYAVAPETLATDVEVRGTWLNGSRIDLDRFLAAAGVVDPADHSHLACHHQTCC